MHRTRYYEHARELAARPARPRKPLPCGAGGPHAAHAAFPMLRLAHVYPAHEAWLIDSVVSTVAPETDAARACDTIQNFLGPDPKVASIVKELASRRSGAAVSAKSVPAPAAAPASRPAPPPAAVPAAAEPKTAASERSRDADSGNRTAGSRPPAQGAAPEPPAAPARAPAGGKGAKAGKGGKLAAEAASPLQGRVLNCLGCGKIFDCRPAAWELSADVATFLGNGQLCTFCGAAVPLSHLSDAAAEAEGAAAAAAAAAAARLVEFDRTGARRTVVIDDQADYYEIDANRWLTPQERTRLRQEASPFAASARRRRRGSAPALGTPHWVCSSAALPPLRARQAAQAEAEAEERKRRVLVTLDLVGR